MTSSSSRPTAASKGRSGRPRPVPAALSAMVCLAMLGCAAAPSLPAALSAGQSPAAPAPPSALPAFCADATPGPALPAHARARLLRDGFVFLEGPVWVEPLGAFLFSEMDFGAPGDNGPPSTIHRLVLPGTFDVFIERSGSNGLAVDAQGLIAGTHDDQALSRYDLRTKRRSVLAAGYAGKRFNSPNDVTIHSAGHIYFTDPDWQIGKRPSETGVTGVYWRRPDGSVVRIEDGLDKPNGIALSPDQTQLYVGSADGVVSRYRVLADGGVGPRETFVRVDQPDGMAVDCAGNLYVASHGPGKVLVHSPAGELISTIEVAPRATNLAFGGPERRTLLITAGGGIHVLDSEIPGFPY